LAPVEYHLTVASNRRRYIAWLLLCAALAVHITDEAWTRFLDLYNPEVKAMGLPELQFSFPMWITLLGLAVVGLLIASHWVRRGTWWTIYAAYSFALLMFSNSAAHLIFSIYQHAWMSGSYTSPLLLAASAYLWIASPRTRV
jgi:hypothetical protein